ncbi:hypothetical protein ES705_35613 [subsurface metagenome]
MEFETLEIKIPKELLLSMEKEKFVEDIKLFTAMWLYEGRVLSLGKAAELGGEKQRRIHGSVVRARNRCCKVFKEGTK